MPTVGVLWRGNRLRHCFSDTRSIVRSALLPRSFFFRALSIAKDGASDVRRSKGTAAVFAVPPCRLGRRQFFNIDLTVTGLYGFAPLLIGRFVASLKQSIAWPVGGKKRGRGILRPLLQQRVS